MTEPPDKDLEPTETDDDSPSDRVRVADPAAARASRRRWRRRRRRLCWWALLILTSSVFAAYWARAPLAELLVERSLPSILSDQLGRPVTIGGARLRETEGREIVLELYEVRIGTPGDGALYGVLHSVTVRLSGWLDLGAGVDVIQGLSLRGGTIELPTPDPDPTRPFPHFTIPVSLPSAPFPIDVTRITVVAGAYRARVDAELSADRIEVDLDAIEGASLGDGPPLRSASLATRWSATGFEAIDLELVQWGVTVSGDLTRASLLTETTPPYTGKLTIEVPGGRGVYGVKIPTDEGERIAAVGRLDLERPSEFAELLGLTTKLPAPLFLSSTVELANDHIAFRGDLHVHGHTVDIDGAITASNLDITASGEKLALGPLLEQYEVAGSPIGDATGTVTVRGDWSAPTIAATLRIQHGQIIVGGERIAIEDATATASWVVGQPINIGTFEAKLFDGTISVTGDIETELTGSCDATLTFENWDVGQLRPWFTYARDLAGRATGTATIRGPWLALDYEAHATVTDATMVFVGYDERLRDVSFDVRSTRAGLTLEGLTAKLGGGTVTGSARLALGDRAGLNENGVESIQLELDLKRVRLIRTRDFWIRGSGDVELTIPFGVDAPDPNLVAHVTVDRGVYDRNFYPRLTEGNSLPFDLFAIESGPFSRMNFDVRSQFDGGFLIRNNYLEVAPHGELRLGGTGKQPVLTGRLSATSGRVKLPHLTMEIDGAEVRFPDHDPFNPDLEFSGRGRLAGFAINATATGKIANLTVSFSSVPNLENEDLLLLVATGWQRAQLADERLERVAALEVARLYGPELWESVFGRSRGDSLLDRVTITTEPGGDGGSDRVSVEVRLLDWLSTVAEQDERGDFNLDLQIFRWYR